MAAMSQLFAAVRQPMINTLINTLHYEDAYRLLPMQHGMLFHSLSSTSSGVYVGQVFGRLPRDLNLSAFDQAWRRVIERHAVLRTSFIWEGLDEPFQRVYDQVSLSIEMHDWTKVDPNDEQQRLNAYLADDRNREFDLVRPPLMRLALLRLANGEYLFLWTHHHALLDGRARVIVLREISQFYEAFTDNRELDLPLPPTYKEYVDWFYQQDWSEARQYWRQLLDGYTSHPPLALLMKAGCARAADKYGTCDIGLSSNLKASLQSIAQQYKVTVNLIVQAGWALQLSHYTGERDIIFGETRACRRPIFQGAASIIGMMMNTVPIKLRVTPHHPFSKLLLDLREQHVALRKYEHTPLSEIRDRSGITKTSELFESIVVFEEYDLDSTLRRDHCALWQEGIRRSVPTHYPLTIIGYNKPELSLHILHDRTVIGDMEAQHIGDHLRTLLGEVAQNPEIACRDLTMLTEQERHQILIEWNNTARDYPQDRCIHELFEAQAGRTPESVALIFEGQKITYQELNRRANGLAHHLRSLGAGPEVLVGICLDRSVEMVVGMLAILKAGGAYVPLDPAYPRERLSFILEDTHAPILITQRHWVTKLFEAGASSILDPQCRVVCLDEGPEATSKGDYENPFSGVCADNIAYVIYTSGSTGRPKGVAIEHRNAAVLIHWAKEVFSAEEMAGVLASTSICFDLSVFELFTTLSRGGKVILAENALQMPVLPSATEVTLVNTVPSAIAELIRIGGVPASVRTLNLAGEPLQTRLVNEIYQQGRIDRVFDLYGPSEDTTYSTFALRKTEGPATIGRPLANKQVYLLDVHLNPVPAGMVGQLYISGAGLARCYLRRPELTAEKWIPNPFSKQSGARLYNTGDLARYLPDGNLEFLGRKDHQVKVRGFRIELGEIETALNRHPAIQDVTVIAREDAQGEKRLAAYLVPHPSQKVPASSELRSFLEERLPRFMIPSAFVCLEALPLTPNGKVDRKALSCLDRTQTGVEQSYVAPGTAAERRLAGIWAEVLRKNSVGIHDDFFELGGDSLSIFRVVARVRQAFQAELPIRAIFDNPTVASLIAVIEAAKDIHLAEPVPAIHSYPRNRELPLSFNEEILWLMAQFYPAYLSFNTQMGVRLRGHLNVHVLKQSLNEIVGRHEILRTAFEARNSRTLRIIAPSLTVEPVKVDLRHIAPDEQDRAARQLAIEEANTPFDLAKGPLMRVKLLEFSDSESVVLLTLHHIISDGWSLVLLSRELKALYGAYAEGIPISLPPLDVHYTDYAIWSRDRLQGETLESLNAFWKRRLNGITDLLRLPPDQSGFALPGLKEETLPFVIPKQRTEALRMLGRQNGVTVFTILLAIFKLLLHRLVSAHDVVVAIPVDERDRSELEGVMGLFANLVVSHTRIDGDCSFTDLLKRIFQSTQESYAYQHLPFAMVEQVVGNHDLGRIIFDYMNGPDLGINLPGLKAEPFSVRGDRPFATDLIFFAHEKIDSIHCSLIYKVALFFPERILDIVEQFQKLISQILESPNRSIYEYTVCGMTLAGVEAGAFISIEDEYSGR